ncbi:SRPBCC domain-containing protein [Lunatibacter salilacus]|uniref:SRPBCC domain-containing protein n=1 Tax=Lunatibacter salilacus TaxID=2483804 RepID=UPI00131B6A03|nr:SRPBCC domain-containing protein [Lunatibacter salilacus]
MSKEEKTIISVSATVDAAINKVWECWTDPLHIVNWNFASDDWHSPAATNPLIEGSTFSYRMEAKDGSQGFDFEGKYDEIIPYKLIRYTLGDGRETTVTFESRPDGTYVEERFEAEGEFPHEMQQKGWQAILDNFKKYTESQSHFSLLYFTILINAPVNTVYSAMLEKFSEWTAVFSPNSYYVGSWEKGAAIRFLTKDEKGSLVGMVSQIKEHLPGKLISIQHVGVVENGKELTEGPAAEVWKGALENYSFKETEQGTLVTVTQDTTDSYVDYFNKTYPEALVKLKEICERN